MRIGLECLGGGIATEILGLVGGFGGCSTYERESFVVGLGFQTIVASASRLGFGLRRGCCRGGAEEEEGDDQSPSPR